MDSIVKFRNLPLAASLLMAAGALVEACTTTTANSTNTNSSTANGTGTGTGAANSTGAGATTTATNTNSSTESTTQSVADSGPTLPNCVVPPSADGGFAPMINFATACTVDGGLSPTLACFGTYPTWYGGTFSYVNTDDTMPNDAGVGCLTFGSQSTFAVAIDTATPAWTWSGTVGGYVGAGLYTSPCIDASQYTGIQFEMYGTIGATGDGGTADEVQIQVSQLQNWNVASAGGTCLASDGGPGATCNPSLANFSVSATAGAPIQIPFSSLLGGQPDATFDPAHIIQIQWQLPWPCTGGSPYMANLTVQNVGFYK